jgi:hypothetical protein
MPLYGAGAQNKNLALFPEKSRQVCHALRIDGVNNYLMFSDKLTQWDNPVVLQNPVFHGNLHKLGIADHFGLRKAG